MVGAAHGKDHAQRLRHRGLPLQHPRLIGLREILAQSAKDGPVSTGPDGTDAIRAHVGTFTDIAKFIPHGGVRAQPPHRLVLLKAGRLGSTLTLSVDDNCHPGGTFPWSLHGIVAFSLTLG